jgi:competence protein ComEA
LVTRFKPYMKDLIRYFLSLSALERKGVLLLVVIMLVITGFNTWLVYHRPSEGEEKNIAFLKELQSFEDQLTTADDSNIHLSGLLPGNKANKGELFYFDPNRISAEDLRRLGMSTKLSETLLNYRLHGGKFYRKEDLKKIYGMSIGVYERLAPYISIPEPKSLRVSAGSPASAILTWHVDINQADSATMTKLHGIGPVLSSRIVRYRSLLGGFYCTGQLKEVYGLSDSLFSIIQPAIYADTAAVKKINLNLASERELARHPYIGKFTARGIIRYRSKVQKITCLDELKINGLVSDVDFERLKKYLTI